MILVLFPLSHNLFTAHLKLKNKSVLWSSVLHYFLVCYMVVCLYDFIIDVWELLLF